PAARPQDGLPGGLGTRDGRLADAGRDAILLDDERKPSRDFRLTLNHRVGAGSLLEKTKDNIAAIRTLKALEDANRDATEEEKAKLARYVGWGALSGAFDWDPPRELAAHAKELRDLLSEEEYES